ncbi:MAG: hypothetical protein H8D45_31035 [Bacteroidetes bacterium]|nr:hypothetical protein [Bacteroidota bacterium]
MKELLIQFLIQHYGYTDKAEIKTKCEAFMEEKYPGTNYGQEEKFWLYIVWLEWKRIYDAERKEYIA